MSRKVFLVFLAIFFLAAFLRFYNVANIPPGVNRDEASIGYTAYSLLHTGKDEYGRFLPLSFQSFGDWKLPFYIYSVVPMVGVFGLEAFSVRLPSVIFGVSSVALTFILIRALFKNDLLALLTMFFVAISPWHLHLSRVESESNTAVFFIILATILFLTSLKKNQWLIIPSAFFFALTYFTYAGNHIFTTLFVLGLVFIYRNEIKIKRNTIIAVAIFLGMTGLIFYHTLFGANITKLSGISIFGDPSTIHAKIEIPRNEHNNPSYVFAKLIHNRITFSLERIGQNYINSYSPDFLFIKGGDNKAHNISNFGNMYLIEALFLFLGLVYLIAVKKGKEKKLILWWFFIAAIAASITKDAPHTNRMFAIFPALPFVVASGLSWVTGDLLNKNFRKIAVLIICIFFILNFSIYIDRYYIHFPRDEEENWGTGYKKLAAYLSESSNASKKAIISRPNYSPYIYILFYGKFDPVLYQRTAVRYPPTQDQFVHVKAFDRFEFRDIDWGKDTLSKNTILADWTSQVPQSIKASSSKHEIVLSNGESMFTVIETK
ncbi:MAG: phospholipid carrier-dependent glycosyltransferase [Patescibacteria group bacterium]